MKQNIGVTSGSKNQPAEPVLRSNDLLFFVNSVFGSRKTPGFRPYQLIRWGVVSPRILARGSQVSYRFMGFPLPGRSLLARGLNFIRIKLFPNLPSRKIELSVFDWACLQRSRLIRETPRVVHLWDHLERTTAYWKSRGSYLVLDMAMAHGSCMVKLFEAGLINPPDPLPRDNDSLEACLELVDCVVCPSSFVLQSLPSQYHFKSVVVPFGADPVTDVRVVAATNEEEAGNKVQVLFAGNVNYRKGVSFLLGAWKKIAPANAELKLCGRIFREASEWRRDCPDTVRFEGFQSDLTPWWQTADIYVLPSLMEGSSKSVYEAMANGIPVVVSSHAGSIIQDGIEGFVVPPADMETLQARLALLISDPVLRHKMGAAGKKTMRNYTWENYAWRIVDIYKNVVKSAKY
jgi:glycosyltransferase involved in cell wall biosynthesis